MSSPTAKRLRLGAGWFSGAMLIALSLVTVSAASPGGRPSERTNVATPRLASRAVPGRLVVGFDRSALGTGARSTAVGAADGRVVDSIGELGISVVKVPSGELKHARAILRATPGVRFVERDRRAVAMDTVPNDSLWSSEWSAQQTRGPAAWDVTTGSPKVVVAVLDTGVDATQPDLAGKLVAGTDLVNNDDDPSDDNGHGTAVAGVIGAVTNNGRGVASYCWACAIMPVKVLDSAGNGDFSVIASGIVWATDHGAQVINMSLAGTSPSAALGSAVTYAHDHGVTLVAAAGNWGNTTPVYPAAYPGVISVAGTDQNDALYSWSNYGSWVKVAAPGVNYTTKRGGIYGTLTGTSSASPVVAGLAGLALSSAPTATNAQVERAIESTTVNIGGSVAYGRVDAASMLASIGGGPSPSPSPSPSTVPSPSPSPSTSPTSPPSPSPSSPAMTTSVWSGTVNRGQTKTYPVTTGTGTLTATLTFKKIKSMTITAQSSTGVVLGSATGPDGVTVHVQVSAGTSTVTIAGSNITAFTLSVSYPSA